MEAIVLAVMWSNIEKPTMKTNLNHPPLSFMNCFNLHCLSLCPRESSAPLLSINFIQPLASPRFLSFSTVILSRLSPLPSQPQVFTIRPLLSSLPPICVIFMRPTKIMEYLKYLHRLPF